MHGGEQKKSTVGLTHTHKSHTAILKSICDLFLKVLIWSSSPNLLAASRSSVSLRAPFPIWAALAKATCHLTAQLAQPVQPSLALSLATPTNF